MNIKFLSTVAVIAHDPVASHKLYGDTLGLPLKSQGGDDHDNEEIAGCNLPQLAAWSRPPRRASGRHGGRSNGRCLMTGAKR